MPRKPPRLASLFVRNEAVLGDLTEEYTNYGRSGSWYWRQVLSLLWMPGKIDRSERKQPMTLLNGLWSDFRYAARTLAKSPGFAAMAMLAIALGVGVNTGIFTLFNAVALRSLPVPQAQSVITVYQTLEGKVSRNVNGEPSLFSYSEYKNYRDHNQSLSGLAAYYPFLRATLDGEHPRSLNGSLASCNYFRVLNVQSSIGRGFGDSDCSAPGSAPVVVLSDHTWRGVFASDRAILGKTVKINRTNLTVIGIAPAGFSGPQAFATDFWIPLTMDPLVHPGDSLTSDNLSWLALLGRLKPGVTLDQARANLAVIASRIDRLYPGRTTTLAVDVATLLSAPEERKGVLTVAQLMFAAVSLVLLIACANVANLLLARATARHKEIAVRLSVGATRARLIRQLLTESVLLALPGGFLGGVAALVALKPVFLWAASHLPGEFPETSLNLLPDLRVLGFTVFLSLITGMVFGLAPALQASRPDLVTGLKEEGQGSGTHAVRGWMRSALVVVQVSICLVLLIAAGLLARGLQASQTIEPGFRIDHVTTIKFDLEQQGYDNARAAVFHRLIAERAASLPGVDAVAEATVVPLSMEQWGGGIKLAGHSENIDTRFSDVSPAYFSVLGIPIVHGRNFTPADARGDAKVAIVMESTARRLWPNEDPLGKVFTWSGKNTSITVIGVARDSHSSSLGSLDAVFLYFPIPPDAQVPLKVLIHGVAPPEQLAKGLRAIVRGVDSSVLTEIKSMDQNLDTYRVPARIVTTLASVLGGFALLLAAIGIYGVVSYAVSRRIREIGIRVALGANRHDVLRLVLRAAMRPVILGLGIGVAACAGVSRVLSGVLYGVSPLDPVAFIAVTLFLFGIAMVASLLPARRATRIDPMEALRYE